VGQTPLQLMGLTRQRDACSDLQSTQLGNFVGIVATNVRGERIDCSEGRKGLEKTSENVRGVAKGGLRLSCELV